MFEFDLTFSVFVQLIFFTIENPVKIIKTSKLCNALKILLNVMPYIMKISTQQVLR